MKKFLCIIVERKTNKTIYEFEGIEASDWYYARQIAAKSFESLEICKLYSDNAWYVDSLEL